MHGRYGQHEPREREREEEGEIYICQSETLTSGMQIILDSQKA